MDEVEKRMARLDPAARFIFFLNYFGYFLVFYGILVFFLYTAVSLVGLYGQLPIDIEPPAWINYLPVVIPSIFVLGVIVSILMMFLSYSSWSYHLGDKTLKIEKGFLFKSSVSIPYSRIQSIEIKKGFLGNLFHTSYLLIQTIKDKEVIPVLSDARALEIRKWLNSIISRTG